MLSNKTVLITGGTGSFGSNFAKFILENYQVKKLIIFSRDELKQWQMSQELNDKRLRFFLGDVRDLPRLQRAFHEVDIVIHAAALKQVPTLEYNPFEAIKTNIFGSQNVIDAAIDQGVQKVVLISTDKAAHPINLYGSTKLCAEKMFVNANSYSAGKTKFSCVRYGNVLGSRGSIVESLLKIRSGQSQDKVYVTDERMTRFWISFEQAFDLVLFTLANMRGGEIFIPKIKSMKLVDLFEAIVPGVSREVIGIRPGEKLHEILLTEDEGRHAVELEKYFLVLPEYKEFFNVEQKFDQLLSSSKPLPPEFSFRSNTNQDWLTPADLQAMVLKDKK
ncbi:MAG: UDP-N-acetylglucosamine 4,6-dehydratase (inverting) [Candidatus Buchananbacteria bacterium RIFCSPHIGHO2_01_FULL_44_11]|uniref:UDP-N-acetylglucosamine 4,6-dehydratase (Inverting) n=1 Tax=Candidatus Buchananbacteria bacterium RIFCSPHIGHO2_01_FULL_44_11 TaxID=1797535 RepID=A0A1G1XZJ4_9BACT|nr:MAG: UDP-N-acetylglucosamine 4,6-dehydratase (inverting) [Candidatus Buchananbacteria bacterium RIFCSPHIGHO2_01_FULL_44_11]